MIDILKYSKKSKLFNFFLKNLLKINVSQLSKPFYVYKNIDLNFDKDFFYEYIKQNKITNWTGESDNEHYQSNHNLQKLRIIKKQVNLLEQFLNKQIKRSIFTKSTIGKFKIKSLWFTIQKKNEGHSSHNHPKSTLSGVYYHQIDLEKGGEIEIDFYDKKITHSPKKNDLIIFNSEIFHSVKPYLGENDRIAIAWDAIYTF